MSNYHQNSTARPRGLIARFFTGVWGLFRGFLLFLGFIMFLSIVIGVAAGVSAGSSSPVLPRQFVLSITVDDGFVEHENFVNPYELRRKPLIISEVVDALDRARGDARVKGLIVRLAGGDITMSQIYELSSAVRKFRESGKFAYIYASSYGGPGGGLGTYYLASSFDQIWLQPMGDLSMAGIGVEAPFAREALDKIGVHPEFFARKEFKSIFESLTAKEMSPANRQATESLIRDIADSFIYGIAENRKIDKTQAAILMDQGVFTDAEALRHNLVTRLDDYETLRETVAEQVTGKKQANNLLVGVNRYIRAGAIDYARDIGKTAPHAAVVYISGMIVSEANAPPGPGGQAAIAEELSDDILDAADDPAIKAIVVRIDSPGGSPSASETIRLALERAKAKGKKVVVSMATTTASGGYWIATAGDMIFTLPVTITGSIGVAGGKFDLKAMWEKLGVRWDSVKVGQNAGLYSMNAPFSASAVERVNATMDHVYNSFVSRVAAGRKMDVEDVEMIARGRVWSGRQALANGLADREGGLADALDYTAEQFGVKDRWHMPVVVLPRPETPLERLMKLAESYTASGYTMQIWQNLSAVLAGVSVYDPVRVR